MNQTMIVEAEGVHGEDVSCDLAALTVDDLALIAGGECVVNSI